MNLPHRLSEHFTLTEMIRSQAASRLGIDNTPTPQVVMNLQTLCHEVLEPIRRYYGVPVIVNSGYRCPTLNRLIGGSPTSQHMTGEAADIEVVGVSNLDTAHWVNHNLRYDQLIAEYVDPTDPRAGWVHVSFRSENRGEALTFNNTGFHPGLPRRDD